MNIEYNLNAIKDKNEKEVDFLKTEVKRLQDLILKRIEDETYFGFSNKETHTLYCHIIDNNHSLKTIGDIIHHKDIGFVAQAKVSEYIRGPAFREDITMVDTGCEDYNDLRFRVGSLHRVDWFGLLDSIQDYLDDLDECCEDCPRCLEEKEDE